MSGQGRGLTAAVVGAGVAGGLALTAAGQAWAWVTAERRPPLPPVTGELTGSAAAPLVPTAGLVLLAAALALIAVSGPARAVVGLLVAAAGGVLAWSGLRVLTGGLDPAAADLPGIAGADGAAADVSAGWPALALAAGLLGVLAGLLVVLRGRRWPAMGRRYERGTPPPTRTDEDRAQAAWKALDRGKDPTA